VSTAGLVFMIALLDDDLHVCKATPTVDHAAGACHSVTSLLVLNGKHSTLGTVLGFSLESVLCCCVHLGLSNLVILVTRYVRVPGRLVLDTCLVLAVIAREETVLIFHQATEATGWVGTPTECWLLLLPLLEQQLIELLFQVFREETHDVPLVHFFVAGRALEVGVHLSGHLHLHVLYQALDTHLLRVVADPLYGHTKLVAGLKVGTNGALHHGRLLLVRSTPNSNEVHYSLGWYVHGDVYV